LFNSIGSRCVANDFSDLDELDLETNQTQITNYIVPYDLYPQVDYMFGSVCWVPPPDNAKEACKNGFNKGIELIFGSGKSNLRNCGYYAHDMITMFNITQLSM
jgi:hypothetical protein